VDEALAVCTEAARKGAHPLRVGLARGEALYRGERYEEAAALFHEVVATAPENDFAVAMLWMSLRYVRLTVEAPSLDVGALRGLLDTRGLPTPESSHVPPQTAAASDRVRAADQAVRGGRFEAAVEGYRAALEHDDLLPDAWRGLAMAQTRLGNARAARLAWTLFVWTAEAAGRSRDKHDLRQARRLLADEARRRGLAAARGTRPRSSPVTRP
jgi:tetratricopeptide (TPR) repeat protein